MEISVMLTTHRVTSEKPLSVLRKILKLQKKSMIGPEKETPMEISVMLTVHWAASKRPLSIMKDDQKLQ